MKGIFFFSHPNRRQFPWNIILLVLFVSILTMKTAHYDRIQYALNIKPKYFCTFPLRLWAWPSWWDLCRGKHILWCTHVGYVGVRHIDLNSSKRFQSNECGCLLFLQLLQHQISGSVSGNHSSGVSFCHHLQLPEQGEKNCFDYPSNNRRVLFKRHKSIILFVFLCCRLMSHPVRASCSLYVWSCFSAPSPSPLSSLSDM